MDSGRVQNRNQRTRSTLPRRASSVRRLREVRLEPPQPNGIAYTLVHGRRVEWQLGQMVELQRCWSAYCFVVDIGRRMMVI